MIVVSNTTPLIGLASILGIKKIGTVGILLKAKQVGLLSAIQPEIQQLHRQGFRLSQAVIDPVLLQANE